MLPFKDENPTQRTPVVTVVVILACLWVYFGWQPSLTPASSVDVPTSAGVLRLDAGTAFTFEWAAIPCEIVEGEPLTVDEVTATLGSSTAADDSCGTGSPESPTVFPDKSVWLALFISMFLHGGLLHLAGNLLFLWVFGNNIEDRLGHVRFTLFYLTGGLVAAASHIAMNLDSTMPVVGASGAIAAVMGAYLIWFPEAPVRTVVFIFFFASVVSIRAKWLLAFWFVTQFFTNPNSGVAWGAHVGGFVFGALVAAMVRASSRARRVAWISPRQASALDRWDSSGGVGAARPWRSERRWP